MRGRTLCVILQNHDEAPINEDSDNLRHFKKWSVLGGKYIVWLRLIIWNHLMWILLNCIEKWNLLDILEVELPYEWKSSALGKNRIFTKIIFQKLSAQDLGGRTVCGILQKWCDSWKYCLLQGEYDFFRSLLFKKNSSKSALEM